MITPFEQYQEDLLSPHFLPDPFQEKAILLLTNIHQQLIEEYARRKSFMGKIAGKKLVKGCYLWGGVGTGKSYLMNTFFHTLPFSEKKRMHFHVFMQYIQGELRARQGEKNPLEGIVKAFASETMVLCFDEFFVSDIVDAMILSELFTVFLAEGICFVATSNLAPENLYVNGLQRARFLPCIELIKTHLTVLKVDNQRDYRLEHTKPADRYFYPTDDYAKKMMTQYFHYYAKDDLGTHDDLYINDHPISVIRRSENVVWFSFAALCETRRNADDYLKIAAQFPHILVQGVPTLNKVSKDAVLRFINLIDILYDSHNELILSVEVPMDKLYTEETFAFEFQRTFSRLQEMQGSDYVEACTQRI
jgi:cell division protein ZapE